MTEFLCRSHPDFHMPAEVKIGKDFDGDAYACRLKENHADAVVGFAKCHYGHAYYPSKYGTVHPRLCKDMMRETAEGCRKHGLGFIAYFSVFLDTCAVRNNPDWALQATSEGVDAGFLSGKFLRLCITSPYLEELFIPQCIEAIEMYEPDEILLDTMAGFQPCYCERCKAKFGHPIPESSDDPRWLEYVAWYRDQFQNFFARVAEALAAVNPDVRVGFNWEWSFRRPADPPEHIGNLMGDLIAAGRIASLAMRYYAGVGLPYAYMTGRFLHGLGDWTSNSRVSLLHTAAAAIAHGADFWIIDRQLPDGSLQDDAFNAMKDVFGFMQPRKEWVSGARHVPETAALFSYDHVMGPELQYFPDMDARKERIMPFEGLNRTFMTTGRHYTALNEMKLLAHLEDYRLVILPEVEFLSDEAMERLRSFVENGGRLLFTQADNANGVYPKLLDMAGVEFEGFSQQDYGYFAYPSPHRISSRFALVKVREGAEVVCNYIEPLSAGKDDQPFGHGFAPPGDDTGRPAIVRNRFGKGEVIYIAASVFREHQHIINPMLADHVIELIDSLLPDPIASIDTEALVELVSLRKGDDLIIHLVNHSAREDQANYFYPVHTWMPEVPDIECRIRTNGRNLEIFQVPQDEKIKCREENGFAVFNIPSLKYLSTVTVADYFKAD